VKPPPHEEETAGFDKEMILLVGNHLLTSKNGL
jgi:hypothetical protein